MSIEVACSSCHRTFPAETHAGLVRCDPCANRAEPRMEHTAGAVIQFEGVWV